MLKTTSSPARIGLRTALGALVASVILLLSPVAASAHDTLVSSSPVAGETVETLPATLTLTFSATLIDADDGTAVEVLDESGTSVAAGEATTEGEHVHVPLAEHAEAGEYQVIWRVVSSDGHPISGEFVFTVATSTAIETPQPTLEPTTEPNETTVTPSPDATMPDGAVNDGAVNTSSNDDPFLQNLPWIIGALIVLGALGAVIAVLVARRRADRQNPTSEG